MSVTKCDTYARPPELSHIAGYHVTPPPPVSPFPLLLPGDLLQSKSTFVWPFPQVTPGDLSTFLTERREAGYAVVALEQVGRESLTL